MFPNTYYTILSHSAMIPLNVADGTSPPLLLTGAGAEVPSGISDAPRGAGKSGYLGAVVVYQTVCDGS